MVYYTSENTRIPEMVEIVILQIIGENLTQFLSHEKVEIYLLKITVICMIFKFSWVQK